MGYLRPKKHPWRNALLITAVALPALYALLGFLVAPAVLRSQLVARLTAQLQRPVTVGQVGVNPFTFVVTVENLEVRERDGRAVFLGWDRLLVDWAVASLWGDEWRLEVIELDGPHGRVVADPAGTLNFSDLLASGEADAGAPVAEAAAGRPLHIARLALNRARVEFRDEGRAQPFTTTLGPISLQVRDFRTVSEADAPYTFEAVTESGERFSWRGSVQAAPFRSRGELTLADLVLPKYAPYYAEQTGLEVRGGRLTVHGRYDFNFDAASRVIRLLDGALEVRDLELADRATGETVLAVPAAAIKGASADGVALTADVREVAVSGGRVALRRERDGTINLIALLRPPVSPGGSAPAPAASAAAEPGGGLTVAEVRARDFAVTWEDRVPAAPARLAAERVELTLRDLSFAPGARMPVQLTLDWVPAGAMRVAGTVALDPVGADVQVEWDAVAASPLNPYLAERLAVRVAEGLVSLGGQVTLAAAPVGPPEATFAGQAWLERFAVRAGAGEGDEIAGFSDLVVSGVEVATAPALRVSVAEANLTGARARLVRRSDGTHTYSGHIKDRPVLSAEPVVALVPPSGEVKAPESSLEVTRLVLAGGTLTWRDEGIAPAVELGVTEVNGTLTGLSSAAPGRGGLDLAARIGRAPVTVAGRFDPLAADAQADLRVEARDVDLRPFAPYSARYAGYALARGRLTLAATARLAARQLDAESKVTLDGFAFGEATPSPEATTLPVRLGVALLQDPRGQIVLDVPVSGRLDDPEFGVGRVAWRVVGNLLSKAAVSPFALLGAVLGGGGDELGWQEFNPGETALTPEGRAKLDALARALLARPALALAIGGGQAPAADAWVLKQRKLEERLGVAWRTRLRAADPPVEVPADAVLPEEERAAVVKHVFDRAFPPGTPLGTPLPPAPPILAPPPPDEDRPWFKRVYDWVLLREQRERAAFRREQEEIQRRYLEQAQLVVDAGLPVEVMVTRLTEAAKVEPAELTALAVGRLAAVRDHLVAAGIGLERLTVEDPTLPQDAVTGAAVESAAAPRVTLELR